MYNITKNVQKMKMDGGHLKKKKIEKKKKRKERRGKRGKRGKRDGIIKERGGKKKKDNKKIQLEK